MDIDYRDDRFMSVSFKATVSFPKCIINKTLHGRVVINVEITYYLSGFP